MKKNSSTVDSRIQQRIEHNLIVASSVNVITGFRLYDKPLLVSYSRSGTNWIRYFIEYVSGKSTPGYKRLNFGNDYVIDRAHNAYTVLNNYKKVMIILRDYRECLLRHNTELWLEVRNAKAFLEDITVPQPPIWYIRNLEGFDKFQGDKLLIYYEDLLANPEIEMRKVARFINLNVKRTEEFLAEIELRKQESIYAYTSGGHKSVTSGEAEKLTYHADTHLSNKQKKAFDAYYEKNYPVLFDKYLAAYSIPD